MEKFKPRECIRTERLVLLKREHEHDQEMWQAIEESRKELREYLFWVDGQQSLNDVVKSTDFFYKRWDDDSEWAYDIYTVDDYHLIGCVGPHAISFLNQSADIGYWLRTSETGKGYMKEAMQAVIKYLFQEENLECVSARAFAPNTASRALLKSLGFAENGIIPRCVKGYTGEIFDDVIHTLFSADFC